jgi:hypothetical protein
MKRYAVAILFRSAELKSTPPIAPLAFVGRNPINPINAVRTFISFYSERTRTYHPKKDSIAPHDDYLCSSRSPSQPSLNQRCRGAEQRAPQMRPRGKYLKAPIGMGEAEARRPERILRRQSYPSMKSSPFEIRSRRSSNGKMPRIPVSPPDRHVLPRVPFKYVLLRDISRILHLKRGEVGTSDGTATKSTDGSACISLASSRILRTPGDFVLSGIADFGRRRGSSCDMIFMCGSLSLTHRESATQPQVRDHLPAS